MNEQDRSLKEQLEAATNTGRGDDSSLDEETMQLRESWLAFTRLVETADELRGPVEVDLARHTVPAQRSVRAWRVLAVAAGFMVAAATWWMLSVNPHQVLMDENPMGGHVATVSPTESTGTVEDVAVSIPGWGDDLETENLTWDDSLDDEIALAEQSVFQLRAGWSGLDSQVEAFYDQIEAYEDEFGEETL